MSLKNLENISNFECWGLILNAYKCSSSHLLLFSNQNQSVYLFLLHIPTKLMTNKKKHFSVVICVCCIMSCSEILLSLDSVFQRTGGTKKKNFLSPTIVQPLVNTSVISQFRENVSHFNFLVNALISYSCLLKRPDCIKYIIQALNHILK